MELNGENVFQTNLNNNIMDKSEFDILSKDLRELATMIPLHWGGVQNNYVDDKINMFQINSFNELEKEISSLDEVKKNYLRRRWYLWKCSQCDEFLFYKNDNTEKNSNPYDKEYDILIDGKYKFDIKGTVIPRSFRNCVEESIIDPEKMIKFFYEKQSTGRRYDIQNRLFIIHHSFVSEEREFYLRCAWQSKERIYKTFCDNISSIKLTNYQNVVAGIIFILEREKGKVECKIYGM